MRRSEVEEGERKEESGDPISLFDLSCSLARSLAWSACSVARSVTVPPFCVVVVSPIRIGFAAAAATARRIDRCPRSTEEGEKEEREKEEREKEGEKEGGMHKGWRGALDE